VGTRKRAILDVDLAGRDEQLGTAVNKKPQKTRDLNEKSRDSRLGFLCLPDWLSFEPILKGSPSATLFVTILSALEIRKALQRKDLRSSRPVWSVSSRRGSNYGLTPSPGMITTTHFRNNRKKRLVRHSPFHHSPPVYTSPLTSRPDQCDELHCVSFHSWEAKLVRKQPDSRACFGSYTLVTGEPTGMDRVKRC
jgi:hypothetical protein